MMTRRRLLKSAVALASMPVALRASAQGFPTNTIKIIVPGGVGGPNDIMARLAIDSLKGLGQSVIAENHPGAGGAIGARQAAKAEPDGHTLLMGNTATLAVLPATVANLGYAPEKAFTPVAKFCDSYQVLVVPSSLPVAGLHEFVAYAKANPGKLNYAHGGTGGLPHLALELLKARTGMDVVPVPFRSDAEAITAVLGDVVQLAVPNMTVALPLIREGRLRALGVTSALRTPLAPDLPTVMEGGVADYEVKPFFGIVAPAGTPTATVNLINTALNRGLRRTETQELFTRLGAVPDPGTPQDFSNFLAGARTRWAAIARDAGFKEGRAQ